MKKSSLLFIGYYLEDVRSLIRLAEAAREGLSLQPVFLIASTGELREQALAEVEAHGYQAATDLAVQNESSGRNHRNPFIRARLLKESNTLLSTEILQRVGAAAVIATTDVAHGHFLETARSLGVPSIYLQWTEVHSLEVHEAWWEAEERWHCAHLPLLRRVKRKLRRKLARLAGLGLRWPLCAPASRLAVPGRFYKEMCGRAGVPLERVVVTGNPQCDDMFRCSQLGEAEFRMTRGSLGIPEGTPMLLYAREHAARITHLSQESAQLAEQTILAALRQAAPRVARVVKVHPKEGSETRVRVRNLDPEAIIVGNEIPIGNLIAASSLVISTTSSSLLWAMGIDRPAISAYFWRGIDEFKMRRHWSGVQHADTYAELVAATADNLWNPAHKTAWRAKRADCRNDFLVLDGRSVERIIGLVSSLIPLPLSAQ
jgi:hypothetical protein